MNLLHKGFINQLPKNDQITKITRITNLQDPNLKLKLYHPFKPRKSLSPSLQSIQTIKRSRDSNYQKMMQWRAQNILPWDWEGCYILHFQKTKTKTKTKKQKTKHLVITSRSFCCCLCSAIVSSAWWISWCLLRRNWAANPLPQVEQMKSLVPCSFLVCIFRPDGCLEWWVWDVSIVLVWLQILDQRNSSMVRLNRVEWNGNHQWAKKKKTINNSLF